MRKYKLIIFTLIAILVVDTFRYLSWVEALNIDNTTYISTLLIYISIFIYIDFIIYSKRVAIVPNSINNLFKMWLLWSVIELIRGAFLAENYWGWKFLLLSSVSFTFITLVFYIGQNLAYTKAIFRFTLKYVFPFGFLLIPLTLVTNEQLYSRLMIPISIFILFIPYLKPKWKYLIIIVAIISILLVIGFRTNIIKISFSVLLLGIFYFRNLFTKKLLRFIHISIFIAPIVLFFLGLIGNYNVFTEISKKEDITIINKEGMEENLLGDTRVFLYHEVLSTMNNRINWLIGGGSSAYYDSVWFYDDGGTMKGKRYGTEVGILNILLRYGIIGVLLYGLLLFNVSRIAITQSNNRLAKMIGLLIAFRWLLSFIEEYTQYDLNFYFFWLIMGLVSTSFFRKMNDKQIRKYLQAI